MESQRREHSTSSYEEEEEEDEVKDQKQQEQEGGDSALQLDLKLRRSDSNCGFNQELNLIDCFNMDSSKTSSETSEANNNTDMEQKVFSCNYCQRKFYSSQALGGHQNAHKRERTLAKRGQQKTAAFGHHHYYSTMAALPLHGTSLGIQLHSVIHKPSHTPSSSLTGFGKLHGFGGWSTPLIDQQPAVGKLLMEKYHVNAASPSRRAPPRHGHGGFSSENTVVTSYPPHGHGNYFHLKGNHDELQKLDLSLKL